MRRSSLTATSLAVAALMTASHAWADNQRWSGNYFPNVVLTTQDGKQVRFYDDLLKGKTVAIYLMYTTCKFACPMETARLAQVQKYLGNRVGKDIFFYSISIDPKRDTPEVLKSYAEKFHAGPGWLFLTGKQEDIDLISKKLGLYTEPDPANQDGHTPSLLVGNESTGQWMRNSALDNPKYLSVMIGQWMNSWKDHKPGPTYAEVPTLPMPDKGHYLFASKCAACHTIGHGDSVGPDLMGVVSARDRVWLTHFIEAPDKMVASKDPLATALYNKYKQINMPNYGMGDTDANAVIEFLKSQETTHQTAQQRETAVSQTRR